MPSPPLSPPSASADPRPPPAAPAGDEAPTVSNSSLSGLRVTLVSVACCVGALALLGTATAFSLTALRRRRRLTGVSKAALPTAPAAPARTSFRERPRPSYTSMDDERGGARLRVLGA